MAVGDEKNGGFGSRGPFQTPTDSDDDDDEEDMSPSVIELNKKRARAQIREYLYPEVKNAGRIKKPVPPRQWLLGNSFCRTFLSMLIGKGGAGKSAFRLLQFIALATGRGDLVGEHVFQRCRILLVSFEDTTDEMERRITAACKHHGIDEAELDGWLNYWTPFGFRLAERNQFGDWTEGSLYTELTNKIRSHEIDLIGIDPFARSHAGTENDNAEMDFVVSLLTKLGADHNIGIDLTHHTRKGEAEAGDADAARGAISVINAARLANTATTMTSAEALKFGIEEDKRKAFFRIDNAKVNLAPPAQSARWFKLVGVPIDNPTALYPDGDNVQTVERWTPPEAVDDLTRDIARKILQRIREGYPGKKGGTLRYSGAPNARPAASAAALVMQYMPWDKKRAQALIATWRKNGVIDETEYTNPDYRRPDFGLVVLQDIDTIYNSG